ncbi:MAG: hypothetical protein CEO21_186, partial [Microgenomates group bacterium Gr01-1014_80]
FPMTDSEYLARTGGSVGMIEELTRTDEALRWVLEANARLAGNKQAVEALEFHDRSIIRLFRND